MAPNDPASPTVDEEMALCVAGFANDLGVPLLRPLASPTEVQRVRCRFHGWGPCLSSHGSVMAFGCIDRQIETLRADCEPPRASYTFGGTVSEGGGPIEEPGLRPRAYGSP